MYRKRETTLTALLKGCINLLNTVLLFVGLAMLSYSCWLFYVLWTEAGGGSLREPPPLSSLLNWDGPWFMYAFGASGLLILITALTGLVGAHHNHTGCLDLNKLLLLILMTSEGALAVVFFSENLDVEKMLPKDPDYEKVKQFVQDNDMIMSWSMLLVIGMQVASLLLACAVTALNDSGDGDMLLEDGYTPLTGGGGSGLPLDPHPVLSPHTPPLPHAPGGTGPRRDDPWSRRMRERYNLDTSAFGYDPESASGMPHTPPLATEPPARVRSGCIVM